MHVHTCTLWEIDLALMVDRRLVPNAERNTDLGNLIWIYWWCHFIHVNNKTTTNTTKCLWWAQTATARMFLFGYHRRRAGKQQHERQKLASYRWRYWTPVSDLCTHNTTWGTQRFSSRIGLYIAFSKNACYNKQQTSQAALPQDLGGPKSQPPQISAWPFLFHL